jgi:hypothetical protein
MAIPLRTKLSRLKSRLKNEVASTFSNLDNLAKFLIILLTSFALFLSPLIIDHDTLPKGFELPKVKFVLIISILIITIGLSNRIIHILTGPKKFNRSRFTAFALIITPLIISTLLSPYKDITFFGNEFRLQGLFTYLLIILSLYFVYESVTKRSIHLIFIAVISVAVIEAIKGYFQFYDLYLYDPDLILEGMWVNGTFGQANFYAGELLTGVVLSSYYLRNQKWFVRLLFSLVIISLLVALAFSYSIWGMISAGTIISLIVLYEIIPIKVYSKLFIVLSVIFPVAFFYYAFYQVKQYDLRIHMWTVSYELFKSIITNISSWPKLLFGYGLDSQIKVYEATKTFPVVIDRAHNIVFDLLIQLGVIGLGMFTGVVGTLYYKLGNNLKNRQFAFVFFGVTIWIFRSMVNTNSIVNLYNFFILLTACFALRSNKL